MKNNPEDEEFIKRAHNDPNWPKDVDKPFDWSQASWLFKFWHRWGDTIAGWAWFIAIMAFVGICTHYHWLGFGSGYDDSDYPYR